VVDVASTKSKGRRVRATGKESERQPAHRRRHLEHVKALAARHPHLGEPEAHAEAAIAHAHTLALLTDDPSRVYAVDVVRTAVRAMLGQRGAELDLDAMTRLRETVRGGATANREADYRELVRFIEARLAGIQDAPRLAGHHMRGLQRAIQRRWPTAFAKLTEGHCQEALAAHRRGGSGRRSTRPIGVAVTLITGARAWGWRDERDQLRREIQQALRRAR
jgi:hypothetical protein